MSTLPEHEVVSDAGRRTKPPFLRRVRIRGYKSIAFCDVTLEPLTILVGRNASGKSNFLDALAFLGDALRLNVTEAVNRHGGFQAIHCRSFESPAVSIEIEAAFSDEAASYVAHYGVTIPANAVGPPVVSQEVLRFEDVTRNRIRQFEAHQGKMEWSGDGTSPPAGMPGVPHGPAVPGAPWVGSGILGALPPDCLHLGYLGEPPFPALADSLRYVGMYNFHPEAIRRPQKVGVGYLLARDGRNLASVVGMLHENDPNLLGRVKAYLAYIVPEVQDFFTRRYDEYEFLRFRLRSGAERPCLEFDAASMSDGTLRALAAIMAAFQFIFPPGRSSVIAIEEAETSLHPAAMRALVDALDEATLRTQVLLTTQSAHMLDNPTIRPENLRIVQMIDGQTVIAPVDEASVEIVRQRLDTLGGLERQNQLEPDREDQERQRNLSWNGLGPQG
jgi:predicted ATPase